MSDSFSADGITEFRHGARKPLAFEDWYVAFEPGGVRALQAMKPEAVDELLAKHARYCNKIRATFWQKVA